MRRPSLNDHLVLRTEDHDRADSLYEIAARKDGLGTFLLRTFGGVGAIATALLLVMVGFAAVFGDGEVLSETIVLASVLTACLLASGYATFRERRAQPAWKTFREANAVKDLRFSESIVRDILTTYALGVKAAEVPSEARVAVHALARDSDGESVQVVLVFPSKDSPVMVSRMDTLAPVTPA